MIVDAEATNSLGCLVDTAESPAHRMERMDRFPAVVREMVNYAPFKVCVLCLADKAQEHAFSVRAFRDALPLRPGDYEAALDLMVNRIRSVAV